jgi:hypothetical protein
VEELTAYTAQQTAEPTAGNKGRKGGKGKGGKGGKGKGGIPEGQRKRMRGAYDELAPLQRHADRGVSPGGEQVLREVLDLMRICIFAHEHRVGNIMWLSWNAKYKKHSRVGFGSHFIAVSVEGARSMYIAMQEPTALPSGHWDLVLKTWLEAVPTRQEEVGFCYILPPIGNFVDHTSGCCADPSFYRTGCWNEPWACPGTAKCDDPKKRQKWLCQMVKEGHPEWVCEVPESEPTAGREIKWMSCWDGAYLPPNYMSTIEELRASVEDKRFPPKPEESLPPPTPQYKGPGVKGKGVGKPRPSWHHGEAACSARQVRRQRRRAFQWSLRNWVSDTTEACWVLWEPPLLGLFMGVRSVTVFEVAAHAMDIDFLSR